MPVFYRKPIALDYGEISREQQVLLALLRVDGGKLDALEEALSTSIDWNLLNKLAARQGLLPILADRVTYLANAIIPEEVQSYYKEVFRVQISRATRMLEWLFDVQALFLKAGIPVIALKGPALTYRIYGEWFMRPLSDLDFLIHPQDFPKCYQLLCQNGYRPSFDLDEQGQRWITRGDRNFSFIYQELPLEIHWQVDESWLSHPLKSEHFWQNSQLLQLSEKEVQVFSLEDTFLHLCLHGTRHQWEKLVWVADLGGFFHKFPDLDWLALWRWGQKYGFQRLLAMGIILAKEVCKAQVPQELSRLVEGQAVAWKLTSQVLSRLLHPGEDQGAKRKTYLKAYDEMKFLLLVREGLHPKLRLICERLVVPKQSDWLAIRLPERYYGLYYLLRPLRLATGFVKNRLVFDKKKNRSIID